MKKILFSLALLAGFATANAQEYNHVVKLNPLGLIFGSAQVAYEKPLTEKSSIVIAPAFGFLKSGEVKYTTYGLGLEYRFYLSGSKSAPEGFYAGPAASFNVGEAKYESIDFMTGQPTTDKTKITGFSGRAIAGYQWVFNGGFALDINGGVQYVSFKYKDSGFGIGGEALSGILPYFGASLGYAF